MATGVPKPAAPSTKAPKLNAIKSACKRRSPDNDTTECLTRSNCPVAMGKSPKAAPLAAAADMVPAQESNPDAPLASGGTKIKTAVSQAVTRPASAAPGAETRPVASKPSRTTTGRAATSVEKTGEASGS